MRRGSSGLGRRHVRVDPIACTGHGLCAALLPEHIALDEWGFPLLDNGRTTRPVDDDALPHARAAVAACPRLALRLERAPLQPPGHRRQQGRRGMASYDR